MTVADLGIAQKTEKHNKLTRSVTYSTAMSSTSATVSGSGYKVKNTTYVSNFIRKKKQCASFFPWKLLKSSYISIENSRFKADYHQLQSKFLL